mmetsp:Transcript_20410/g.51022  ORF Transcript_20410/g.51022 Transcript_20410/m.51022 type:complete len:497 (-) Transcript_20410:40-1530(-)
MLPTPASLNEPGLSLETVNVIGAVLAGGVVSLAALGAAADAWLRWHRLEKQHLQKWPSLWALFTLVASYALLIPGLSLMLFKYSLSILTMEVTSRSENTIELVQGSADRGMVLAAAFIATYAMAIPAVKVVLLILGQALQRGGRPGQVRWARRCILTVQAVSKWASPDMFAYILMLCLFRGLDKPPNLKSEMHLGLGFSCFAVFCVGSTVSSLGVPLPSLPADARETAEVGERQAKVTCRLAGWPALALVVALTVAFTTLLLVGMTLPVMELRLDMALLYEKKPQLKPLQGFINELHLPELMHEDVSGWTCLLTLAADIAKGNVNSGLAFVLYGVFTFLLPFLDMLALLFAACCMHRSSKGSDGGVGSKSDNCSRTSDDGSSSSGSSSGSSCSARRSSSRGADFALAASHVLGKLSMLDVSIMGVVVIVLSMESMRENGVILSMRLGIPILLGAEICHYLAWFVLCRMRADSAASSGQPAEDVTGRQSQNLAAQGP